MRTLPAFLPLLACLLLACQTPPGAQASSASKAPAGAPAGEGSQGTPDEGDQYRSEIFTFSGAQADAARRAIVDAQAQQEDKIVTKVEPIGPFYKAEDDHQQYAERTGHHGCPVGKLSDI